MHKLLTHCDFDWLQRGVVLGASSHVIATLIAPKKD